MHVKAVTEDGSTYQLSSLNSGFYSIDSNPNSLVAFVRDRRKDLCEEALYQGKKLVISTDPAGSRAIGFEGSNATLSASPPKVGFRMFMIELDKKVKPTRLSEPIVDLEVI